MILESGQDLGEAEVTPLDVHKVRRMDLDSQAMVVLGSSKVVLVDSKMYLEVVQAV